MMAGIYSYPLIVDRFWEKVAKQENGCWEWIATIQNLGYGQFSVNGHLVLAHRFSYELVKGVIPDGYEIDHLCRNHKCVNPDHLEVVTHQENCVRGLMPELTRRRQLAKTHCPKGHPYDSVNTYVTPKGKRNCRACCKEANKRYKERKNNGSI